MVFLAALCVGVNVFVQEWLLGALQPIIYHHLSLSAVLSSVILFAPASIILGMVSPYAVRLRLESLATSGATIGNLYAISTLGSIVGTFVAGFYLIPALGTVSILILLALTLVLIALIVSPPHLVKSKATLALLLVGLLQLHQISSVALANVGFFDIDTAYSRVLIYPSVDKATSRATLNMSFDPFGTQSAIFLEGDDSLVLPYAHYYDLASWFVPGLKKSLILGGAAYTYPRHHLERYPEATVDVVEIDPALTKLAREHFRLKDDPRLAIYHYDARVFLNQTSAKYDVIFGDAFQSPLTVPYQLTTREVVEKMHAALSNDGAVFANLISAIDGPKGEFLRAEYATYKSLFPQVYLFPVQSLSPTEVQNVVLVALKGNAVPQFDSADSALQPLLSRRWTQPVANDMPILTDDLAPVDYYIHKIL
jgi:spermidine synthase